MAIEIADLPIENKVISHSFVAKVYRRVFLQSHKEGLSVGFPARHGGYPDISLGGFC